MIEFTGKSLFLLSVTLKYNVRLIVSSIKIAIISLRNLSSNHRRASWITKYKSSLIGIRADINSFRQELSISQARKSFLYQLEVRKVHCSFKRICVNENFRFRCHLKSSALQCKLNVILTLLSILIRDDNASSADTQVA